MSEWWEKPGRMDDLRERFKPDGLLRLARSSQEYYDSHGHYLPGVAVLAMTDGARVRELEAALRAYSKFDDVIAALSDARRDDYKALLAALAVSPEERGETT